LNFCTLPVAVRELSMLTMGGVRAVIRGRHRRMIKLPGKWLS
jgi:hypothetical protein